ncbi:MAG: type II toxin-antitoxin system MqsA family antitoxin [Elusimicrobia bacterium]|nr:type II toxin-antitoxin system MqsA family antitoxin [Elusimicrobiota bacterium]
MKRDVCPLCGGKKIKSKTTYSVDFKTGVIVIRNVPCMVCVRCGEEWISPDIAKELELIVQDAKMKKMQTEILSFPDVAILGTR